MNEKIVAILGVFAIAVVITCLGCIDGGSSAKDMAKMVPKDASIFTHFDLQTMRDDKDLEEIYEKIAEVIDDDLDVVGLESEDITHMASVIEEDGNYELVILKGDFDLEDVRDELDDANFDEDEYKGVEFWKAVSWLGGDSTFAISGDMLICGDKDSVKDCIKVMKGSEQSVYDDNEDFRDVIDRLPRGISTVVSIPNENALAVGFVRMREDEDTFKMKGVAKFDDEDEAEDEKSDTKREMEKMGEWFDAEVKQSGKFLEFTAKIDIEDFDIENLG